MFLWMFYQILTIGLSIRFSKSNIKFLQDLLAIFFTVQNSFVIFDVIAVNIVVMNIYFLICILSLFRTIRDSEDLIKSCCKFCIWKKNCVTSSEFKFSADVTWWLFFNYFYSFQLWALCINFMVIIIPSGPNSLKWCWIFIIWSILNKQQFEEHREIY